jgi:hypothetical protein
MIQSRNSILLAFMLGIVVLAASALALWQLQDAGAAERDTAQGTLGPGQHLVLRDGTVLRFVGVVGDSRCPADVMCIHQGEAVVAFELEAAGGEAGEFEMTFDGGVATASVDGYSIELAAVWPYPLASQPAEAGDYTVEVTIEVE